MSPVLTYVFPLNDLTCSAPCLTPRPTAGSTTAEMERKPKVEHKNMILLLL